MLTFCLVAAKRGLARSTTARCSNRLRCRSLRPAGPAPPAAHHQSVRGLPATALSSAIVRQKEPILKRLGIVSALLVGLMLAAGTVELPGTPVGDSTQSPAGPPEAWRRTDQGWVHAYWLYPQYEPSGIVRLHPAVVAILTLLASVAALVASSPAARAGSVPRCRSRRSSGRVG